MRKHYTVVRYNLLMNFVQEKIAKVGLAEAISLVEDGNRIHRMLRTSQTYREAYAKQHGLSEAQTERLCMLAYAIKELMD